MPDDQETAGDVSEPSEYMVAIRDVVEHLRQFGEQLPAPYGQKFYDVADFIAREFGKGV